MNDIDIPTIRVCIAIYNGSKFIERQLKSISEQINSGDQIVIEDDNSTDNTLEIISLYADDRFLIIKNVENEGSQLKNHFPTWLIIFGFARNVVELCYLKMRLKGVTWLAW